MDKMTVDQASAAENKEPPKGCSCPQGEGPDPCPGQHALWHCQHEAVLRGTHKIVPASFLTPPQDVAELVEELRKGGAFKFSFENNFGTAFYSLDKTQPDPLRAKAATALLSLSARIRELEAEVSRLTNLAQEGRKAALEEAANVAHNRQNSHGDCDYNNYDSDTGAWECTKRGDCLCQERIEEAETIELAIRALIPQEPEEE